MSLILSGTDGLSDVDGSAATPAIRGTDANTGIFFPAADTIAFAEGGAEVARFDSAGNFGLGATPSAWNTVTGFQVGRASLYGYAANEAGFQNNAFYSTVAPSGWKYIANGFSSQIQLDSSGNLAFKTAPSGTAGNAITFTQAMTLDADGDLGIGTTSPAAKMHIGVASAAVDGTKGVRITNPAGTVVMLECGNGGDSFVGTTSGSDFNIRTGNVTRATFDNSGNLLVGKTALNLAVGTSIDANTSTGSGVRVVSSASTASADGFQMYSTGTSTYRFAVGFNGTISAVSTVISSISDARLKENVRDLNVGLSEIMALKPRLYDWKEGKGANIKNARGFIAQEFETVFPDLIDESRDPAPEGEGPYKAVRADLIPVLVKAIQEQQALIQTLTARITALESA